MFDLSNRRPDDLAHPAWVRALGKLDPVSYRTEFEKLLKGAVEFDDARTINGLALLQPHALNMHIHDWGCTATTKAFETNNIQACAALLANGTSWIKHNPSKDSPFVSVCVTENLETAVSRAVRVTNTLRNLGKIDPKFPGLTPIDNATWKLITKFDRFYPSLDVDEVEDEDRLVLSFKRMVLAYLRSPTPLAHLEEIVEAVEYVVGLLSKNREQEATPFTRMAIRSFHSNSLNLTRAVVRCIDSLVFDANKPRHTHASQAELMLLFNHPGISSSKRAMTEVCTALTATDIFARREVTSIPRGTLHSIFGRVGQLTFGSLRFKYDSRTTKGCPKSLLEEFGFRDILDAPETKLLGKCFVWQTPRKESLRIVSNDPEGKARLLNLDGRTIIVLRHSGIAIHHPDAGSLWIRNSSLIFGRDTMYSPAYFAPKMPREWANRLRPDGLSRMYNVACHEIFHHSNRELLQQVEGLLDQAEAFLHLYRAWKFDTNRHTAWKPLKNGHYRVKGLYLSPGFAPIVDRLSDWFAETHSASGARTGLVPSIGFVPAAHLPFTFLRGRDGLSEKNGVAMTPRNLTLLQELASGDSDLQELQDTDLWRFFQHAAIYQEGELILRDPITDREIT